MRQQKMNEMIMNFRRAVYTGSVDTVKDCIELHNFNAARFCPDELLIAIQRGYTDIVEYFLVKKLYDPNAHHGFGLCTACRYGHLDIVKLLVEHGANIHVCDDRPLLLAARNKRVDVADYLLSSGGITEFNTKALLKTVYYLKK